MDLNRLFCEHQVALHDLAAGASRQSRRLAHLRVEFYARLIRRMREGFARRGAANLLGYEDGASAHG